MFRNFHSEPDFDIILNNFDILDTDFFFFWQMLDLKKNSLEVQHEGNQKN